MAATTVCRTTEAIRCKQQLAQTVKFIFFISELQKEQHPLAMAVIGAGREALKELYAKLPTQAATSTTSKHKNRLPPVEFENNTPPTEQMYYESLNKKINAGLSCEKIAKVPNEVVMAMCKDRPQVC